MKISWNVRRKDITIQPFLAQYSITHICNINYIVYIETFKHSQNINLGTSILTGDVIMQALATFNTDVDVTELVNGNDLSDIDGRALRLDENAEVCTWEF